MVRNIYPSEKENVTKGKQTHELMLSRFPFYPGSHSDLRRYDTNTVRHTQHEKFFSFLTGIALILTTTHVMLSNGSRTASILSLFLLLLQSIYSLHIPIIPIIYESKEILAINKPSGIPHHSTTDELGIVALIRQQYDQKHPTTRLYSVHRLDRVTSGILLLAKTPEAARELTRLFREKKIVGRMPRTMRKRASLVRAWGI